MPLLHITNTNKTKGFDVYLLYIPVNPSVFKKNPQCRSPSSVPVQQRMISFSIKHPFCVLANNIEISSSLISDPIWVINYSAVIIISGCKFLLVGISEMQCSDNSWQRLWEPFRREGKLCSGSTVKMQSFSGPCGTNLLVYVGKFLFVLLHKKGMFCSSAGI